MGRVDFAAHSAELENFGDDAATRLLRTAEALAVPSGALTPCKFSANAGAQVEWGSPLRTDGTALVMPGAILSAPTVLFNYRVVSPESDLKFQVAASVRASI